MTPGDMEQDRKYPMIVMLHGGPFSSMPYDMFLVSRNFLML